MKLGQSLDEIQQFTFAQAKHIRMIPSRLHANSLHLSFPTFQIFSFPHFSKKKSVQVY
jgi:hypothetical protein